MRFGFHISINGGFSQVVKRAKKNKCETIQIFSRNPRGWKYSPFNPREVEIFKKEIARSSIFPVFVHLPYLPNLASPKADLYGKSVASLVEDLRRGEILEAPFLIIHVGSRVGTNEENAVNAVARGINEAFLEVNNRIVLLLENTAGQGSEIGHTFAQIKAIIDKVDQSERVGVCLDTAHAFEAGYNISNKEGLDATLEEFDKLIGLKKLRLIHLNDSKTPLGSRVDRHWHIGKGEIGIKGFENIVNHPSLIHLPGIMETPRKNEEEDQGNMAAILNLAGRQIINFQVNNRP